MAITNQERVGKAMELPRQMINDGRDTIMRLEPSSILERATKCIITLSARPSQYDFIDGFARRAAARSVQWTALVR
jgi:hypothetical protein